MELQRRTGDPKPVVDLGEDQMDIGEIEVILFFLAADADQSSGRVRQVRAIEHRDIMQNHRVDHVSLVANDDRSDGRC